MPLANRLVSADGSAITTIKNPSMFSNNIKMTTGTFSMDVADLTAKDGMGSEYTVDMEATFTGPNGREFRVNAYTSAP